MFSPWRKTVRRRVVVNLTNENAITGVLFEVRGPLLVLRNATLLEVGKENEPSKIDGECIIERVNVEFIQVLPGG